MQQNDKMVKQVVQGNEQGDLPVEMIEEIKAAGAVLMIGLQDGPKGQSLTVVPSIAGGQFTPETNAVHAYVQAVVDEHVNLIRRVNGVPTDGDRYRALRDFAVLAATDKSRFERINEQFQKLEESLPPPDQRAPADHDQVADFLAFAILESEPGSVASGDEQPGIILPHAPVLAKPH